MTAPPLQKHNQVHGADGWGEGEASAKLLPVPGSQVESQAGKCSLQALGWAVEKQLRIGGCRAKMGFPRSSAGRLCLQCGRPGFNPWVGKIPWRRERLPPPGLKEKTPSDTSAQSPHPLPGAESHPKVPKASELV